MRRRWIQYPVKVEPFPVAAAPPPSLGAAYFPDRTVKRSYATSEQTAYFAPWIVPDPIIAVVFPGVTGTRRFPAYEQTAYFGPIFVPEAPPPQFIPAFFPDTVAGRRFPAYEQTAYFGPVFVAVPVGPDLPWLPTYPDRLPSRFLPAWEQQSIAFQPTEEIAPPIILAHGIPIFIPGITPILEEVEIEAGAIWAVSDVTTTEIERTLTWRVFGAVGAEGTSTWGEAQTVSFLLKDDWGVRETISVDLEGAYRYEGSVTALNMWLLGEEDDLLLI